MTAVYSVCFACHSIDYFFYGANVYLLHVFPQLYSFLRGMRGREDTDTPFKDDILKYC